MTKPVLEINNLSAQLDSMQGPINVVDNVSFSIPKGETFALLGESGCGKSMTALSIMRLLPQPAGKITHGEINLDGENILALPENRMRDVRGKRIAMIFQEPMTSLNPVLTVEQQIGEMLTRHLNMKGQARQARVLELLNQVGIPEAKQRMHEYPHQLSGGMKQRVMIAIALACDPDVLIADEPTTALDVTIQAQILDLLKSLQQKYGMALLLITHDLGVVAQMADRVAVMYAGELVETASKHEFFAKPLHPYSQKLFKALPDESRRTHQLSMIPGFVPSLATKFTACRFAPRCTLAWDLCKQSIPDWYALKSDNGVRCFRYAPGVDVPDADLVKEEAELAPVIERGDANKPVLDVNGLKVHFPIQKGLFKKTVGHVFAVDDVSISIQKSTTLALVGESGCGKTTVGKSILQLIKPTAGSIKFDGVELNGMPEKKLRSMRKKFQIIFQDPFSSMNPRMMVGDIIEEGMLAQNIGQTKQERKQKVDELLLQVGMSPEMAARYPHEFSGGQRQRICIARALAVNPEMIVCDEPTSALDISVQAQVLNLLKRLQHDFALSYLFITHNIAVVGYLADEVAVMYLGRIVEYGTVSDVLDSPKHPYTIALLSAVPVIDFETKKETLRLEGDMPSPVNPPQGCYFHPRCPKAQDRCRKEYPGVTSLAGIHQVSCHFPE